MNPSFIIAAATWQNFYMLVGAAAATLIGLMFVAVTFGSSLVTVQNSESSTAERRAFLDPTLTHFVQVLVTACLITIPTMGATLLGGLLMAIGVLRVAALFRVHRHMKAAQESHNDIELSDWMSGIVGPFIAHVLLLGVGIAFLTGHAALNVLALVTLIVLLNGIYGAWELMVWLALTRARTK